MELNSKGHGVGEPRVSARIKPAERWEADGLLALPFDQYQRQRQAAQILEALRAPDQSFRVVDIGGGAAPVRPFLDPDDLVVQVDLHPNSNSQAVKGHGAHLPFSDSSFEFALALDTLEHVQPELRLQVVDECVRVAKTGVVLIGPFASPEADLAESLLFEFIRCTLGGEHKQLKEHLVNGLPDRSVVDAHLKQLGYPYLFGPSGYVHRWLAMMLLKHYLLSLPASDDVHRQVDRYYNRYYFEFDQRAPSYRSAIFIARNGSEKTLEMARRSLPGAGAGESTRVPRGDGDEQMIGQIAIRQALAESNAKLRERERELADARDLLDRISRGKIMRLMNSLQSLKRKLVG